MLCFMVIVHMYANSETSKMTMYFNLKVLIMPIGFVQGMSIEQFIEPSLTIIYKYKALQIYMFPGEGGVVTK